MSSINIFWFRRDLRLHDNHGLFKALKTGNVLPVFIFDSQILTKLENPEDPRISFIYKEIKALKKLIETYGSTLMVYYGKPLDIFKNIAKSFNINSVYFNHDYEPYSIQRDKAIYDYLTSLNIKVFSFKDQVIFEKSEICKPNGEPYTVFTPYSKKWKSIFNESTINYYHSEDLAVNFYKTSPVKLLSIEQPGFKLINYNFPSRQIDKNLILNYDKTRDYPFLNGTSKLSIHLRFGTISIRELVKIASKLSKTYLNELIWREFYMMILWNFPHVVNTSFKKQYENLEWRNNEEEFSAWCNGKTGYPIVDAGMRELNKTGFMHNRLRMITAGFLTKHLLIDWRWGETYFSQKLSDYELSSNNGGWQWAASTGCDAVPYFRIFNPHVQRKKFDPDLKYIKKWLSDYESGNYPIPIINHKFARERALSTFKKIMRS